MTYIAQLGGCIPLGQSRSTTHQEDYYRRYKGRGVIPWRCRFVEVIVDAQQGE